jgi:hypothetical protein
MFFPAVFGMPLSGAEPGRPSTNNGKHKGERGVRSKAKAKPGARPEGWEGATPSSHRDAGGDTGWHIAQRRKKKAKQRALDRKAGLAKGRLQKGWPCKRAS